MRTFTPRIHEPSFMRTINLRIYDLHEDDYSPYAGGSISSIGSRWGKDLVESVEDSKHWMNVETKKT